MVKDQVGEKNPFWKGGISSVKSICQRCGGEFFSPLCAHAKFCSIKCYNEHRSDNLVLLNCGICGAEFTRPQSSVVRGWGKFCSRSCASKAIARKHFCKPKSEEHKRKIRESNIKTKRAGKLFSDRELMALARKSSAYKRWQAEIFKFDNYACVRCGKRGGSLNAHHIDSFAFHPEFRLDQDNGITLCEKCHNLVHTKGFLEDAEKYACGVAVRGGHACVI